MNLFCKATSMAIVLFSAGASYALTGAEYGATGMNPDSYSKFPSAMNIPTLGKSCSVNGHEIVFVRFPREINRRGILHNVVFKFSKKTRDEYDQVQQFDTLFYTDMDGTVKDMSESPVNDVQYTYSQKLDGNILKVESVSRSRNISAKISLKLDETKKIIDVEKIELKEYNSGLRVLPDIEMNCDLIESK